MHIEPSLLTCCFNQSASLSEFFKPSTLRCALQASSPSHPSIPQSVIRKLERQAGRPAQLSISITTSLWPRTHRKSELMGALLNTHSGYPPHAPSVARTHQRGFIALSLPLSFSRAVCFLPPVCHPSRIQHTWVRTILQILLFIHVVDHVHRSPGVN